MSIFRGKSILVTGGTGLIGRPLVEILLAQGAKVRVASLDDPSRAPAGTEFVRTDLTLLENCLEACRDMDQVFHLAGIKGSPAMTHTRPASFFFPTVAFNTNMMEAARRRKVDRYLFTSTVGVYAPAEVMREDDVWRTFPSPNDRFAGWAKRLGELQAEAYALEYGWDRIGIVRPPNVYGPYDNFDPEGGMVVPSLIRRAVEGERPLTVWGDGSPVRDFIHARDVARGMLLVMEKGLGRPVNLGSGTGVSIRRLVEVVVGALGEPCEVAWDTSKPAGDKMRVLDVARATAIGFRPEVSLEEGIAETMAWYRANRTKLPARYDVFKDATFRPQAKAAAR
jgi:GDP-L-fucose synthase